VSDVVAEAIFFICASIAIVIMLMIIFRERRQNQADTADKAKKKYTNKTTYLKSDGIQLD
jgi:hypothetical protein